MAIYYYESSTSVRNEMYNYSATVRQQQNIKIGVQIGWNSRAYRAIVRPDLSGIPSNATITSASLVLQILSFEGGNGPQINLFRSLRNWNPSVANWSYYDGSTAWTGGMKTGAYDVNMGSLNISSPVIGTYYNVPVNASYATQWVQGTVAQNGYVVKQTSAQLTDDSSHNSSYTNGGTFKAYYSLADTVGAGRASWFI